MDCNAIIYLLNEIKREADNAKAILNGGNTGNLFKDALDRMVRLNADIRNEIKGINNRAPT